MIMSHSEQTDCSWGEGPSKYAYTQTALIDGIPQGKRIVVLVWFMHLPFKLFIVFFASYTMTSGCCLGCLNYMLRLLCCTRQSRLPSYEEAVRHDDGPSPRIEEHTPRATVRSLTNRRIISEQPLATGHLNASQGGLPRGSESIRNENEVLIDNHDQPINQERSYGFSPLRQPPLSHLLNTGSNDESREAAQILVSARSSQLRAESDSLAQERDSAENMSAQQPPEGGCAQLLIVGIRQVTGKELDPLLLPQPPDVHPTEEGEWRRSDDSHEPIRLAPIREENASPVSVSITPLSATRTHAYEDPSVSLVALSLHDSVRRRRKYT
ncbi:hypothetical protein NEOLEDRAFT_914386 [Neolentinus lepideus HHB14362 ss-1]|uniref:Uncharacterized protein n=1 Tax=Neolentinus lepideus HHB14362 ss-1 TaxID=1314782 RepID=A0A165UKW2_9AGAM|nr:hypothetical protein NEOLEDRAFT_914386 [Neolentinus lepideus HHB14362 ss-1]